MNSTDMNCTLPHPDSKACNPASDQERHSEFVALERIGRILDAKQIDLGELVKEICAVPDVAQHLRRMVSESGAEFETLSDAAVLAGRSGIRMILCNYCHVSHAAGRAVLFVLPQNVCSQHHSSSTHTKSR
jgi:hypothetical protein